MPVDSATTIAALNTALPTGADAKSEGDDNFRHIKTVLKAAFPNVAGAVSATDAELSRVAGVTSAIQPQINATNAAKATKAGDTYTGTHDFSGAAMLVATPVLAAQPVTKAYADGLAFASALPSISAATKDKVIVNNGATAAWADAPLVTAESLFLISL